MMDSPQGRVNFVRLEYWDKLAGNWSPWHSGLSLIDPAKYVQKTYTENNILARAIDIDTAEIHYGIEGAELL